MSDLKLVSFPICPFVQRSAFYMQLQGIDYQVEYIDLMNKPDWFMAISPMGKVPVLQVGDTVLFESQVILEYLNDTNSQDLHPSDPLDKARQRALIEFGSSMLGSQWAIASATGEDEFYAAKETLTKQLTYLENQLSQQPFFNGDEIRVIDVAFAPLLQRLSILEQHYISGLFSQSPKVKAWADALLTLPAFKRSAVEDLEQRILNRINGSGGFLAQS